MQNEDGPTKKGSQKRKRTHPIESTTVIPAKKAALEPRNEPSIEDLPFMLVVQIASKLSMDDMYTFWCSGRYPAEAVDHYWFTRRTLCLSPSALSHYFPYLEQQSTAFSVYSLREEISQLIACLPHHRLNTLDCRGLKSFKWSILTDIFEETGVDIFNLFSCVENLYLVGCAVSSEDFEGIASIMRGVRRISLTSKLFHIYQDDERPPLPSVSVEDQKNLTKERLLNDRRLTIISHLKSLFPVLECVTIH